jgi:hypothetical protein
MPDKDMKNLLQIVSKKNAQFPHCIGAVDGKHIHVQKFPNCRRIQII